MNNKWIEEQDLTHINEEEVMEYYGYSGRTGQLKFKLQYLRSWILHSIAYSSPHPGLAAWCQKKRGVKMGKNCHINPYVLLDLIYPHLLTIGDNVTIGSNSMIFTHSVPSANLFLRRHGYGRKVQPVNIKSGAVIFPGCIIKSGVTIGENSMIAIGSVVTNNIPDYSISVGNPARVVRKILPHEKNKDDDSKNEGIGNNS